jgi:hypothetical protein
MTTICEMCHQPITAGHPNGPRTTRVRPYGLPGRLVFHAECGRVWSAINRGIASGRGVGVGAAVRPAPRAAGAALRALGLTTPCTPRDVRRAYRRLALERHPDRGGSHEAFLALQKDYEAALRLVGGGVPSR